MTTKQKANAEKFKKAVAEAKKLRKKNPKLTHAQAVKQAFAILYKTGKVSGAKKTATKKKTVKKKTAKKPTEKAILNKIHKVKSEVNKLDEAQHKHMCIGKVKTAGIGALTHKYGKLSTKKLMAKTKRLRTQISKEMRDVVSKIKKLKSL